MGPKAVTYTPRRNLLRKASVTQYFGLVVCTYHVPISVVIVNKNDATVNQQTISFNKIKHKLVQERNYFQWENDTHKKKQSRTKESGSPVLLELQVNTSSTRIELISTFLISHKKPTNLNYLSVRVSLFLFRRTDIATKTSRENAGIKAVLPQCGLTLKARAGAHRSCFF